LLLLPVGVVLAARPDFFAAVLLDDAGLSLGLRDAALRDLFVRTTTIGLLPCSYSPPLSPLSSSVSSTPAQSQLPVREP